LNGIKSSMGRIKERAGQTHEDILYRLKRFHFT
jgi:hypothetical protein